MSTTPPQGSDGWQQPGRYPPPPPPPPGGWDGGWEQPGQPGQYPPPRAGGPWPQGGPGGQLAGWWQRVGATIVDGLVLAVPFLILVFVVRSRGVVALLIVLQAIYLTVMLARRGQSVGNMAVGTRVVDARTGGPLSYGKALGRWAGQEVFNIIPIAPIIDILWPLWDGQNQTLHDKMAATVVLRT